MEPVFDHDTWCIIWVRKGSTQPTITSDVLESLVSKQMHKINEDGGNILLSIKQSDLLRFQDLISQCIAMKEACLNAIGFIGGQTILTKDVVLKRLSSAVKPLLRNSE